MPVTNFLMLRRLQRSRLEARIAVMRIPWEDDLIIDERTYTIHIGKIPDYLKLYQAEGLEIQKKTLGNLIGYFVTEIGTLSTVVHLWAYDSMEDRAQRRATLAKDPAWQAYLAKMQPLVTAMENRILAPTSFSPLR